MTTRTIAQRLASAAAHFPFLGISSAQDLLDVVRCELGHEQILDDFQTYGAHRAMAMGPGTILHIISGNTPHAGLQSLIRGLLLKARNLCKIPSSGMLEIARFRDALPPELAGQIEISPELPDGWLAQSGAVIVFGSDETILHFRGLVRPEQIFIGHGHKVSLGLVFDDPDFVTVASAAVDASMFDQQGCLSPHVFYVNKAQACIYAEKLALEMEAFNRKNPRSVISQEAAAAINEIRGTYEFRAANNRVTRVWKSGGSTDWTVIFDPDSAFSSTCLNRVIFVKPLPEDLAEAVALARPHLATIAIHPSTRENAGCAVKLGATRICAIGCMQSPPFTWHQDGGQNLAPLVRWVDFEG